ncbi:MAG: hypothetical protein RIK87_19670 [Fuerstiella sp.]
MNLRRLTGLALLVCSLVCDARTPASAEIKVTGRATDKQSSTSSTDLAVTRTGITSRTSGLTSLTKTSTQKVPRLVSTTPLSTLSKNLFQGLDFGMTDPEVSSASISAESTALTIAPGETLTIPVTITRNGVIGNLYFAGLFDYGDSLSAGDMAWMEQFTVTVNPVCPATGLLFADNVFELQIHAQASAVQGTVGTFRLIGHEVSSGAQISDLNFDVQVDGEPMTASDTAMLSFQSTLTNPFINGDFVIQGQQSAAFLDYNNDGFVSFSTGTPFGVYPVTRFPNAASDLGWSLTEGGAFDNGANLVVVGMLSSWSTVDRPQFVALYLKLEGQQVTPISMWAGDMLNDAPVAPGTTAQGIVMGTTFDAPPAIDIDPVTLPTAGAAGIIRGVASANVWSNTASGNLYGTTVTFSFDVPLQHDGQD